MGKTLQVFEFGPRRCREAAPWTSSYDQKGPRDVFFAAMPPFETKKALFLYVQMCERPGRRKLEAKLFADVKKAHFTAR